MASIVKNTSKLFNLGSILLCSSPLLQFLGPRVALLTGETLTPTVLLDHASRHFKLSQLESRGMNVSASNRGKGCFKISLNGPGISANDDESQHPRETHLILWLLPTFRSQYSHSSTRSHQYRRFL